MKHKSKFPKSTKRRGFTLIELIVVMLIIAILAALVVPRVIGRTGDAKRSKALSDIASFSNLLQQFHADTGRFPTTEEGLNALYVQPADIQNWKGPYTTKPVPPDPWGFDYIYEYPGSGGDLTYVLASLGADGQEGGEGENTDIMEGADSQ